MLPSASLAGLLPEIQYCLHRFCDCQVGRIQHVCICCGSERRGGAPGIARIMPGEEIDQKAIEYLTAQERAGGSLFGVYEGRVFVVDETQPLLTAKENDD